MLSHSGVKCVCFFFLLMHTEIKKERTTKLMWRNSFMTLIRHSMKERFFSTQLNDDRKKKGEGMSSGWLTKKFTFELNCLDLCSVPLPNLGRCQIQVFPISSRTSVFSGFRSSFNVITHLLWYNINVIYSPRMFIVISSHFNSIMTQFKHFSHVSAQHTSIILSFHLQQQ